MSASPDEIDVLGQVAMSLTRDLEVARRRIAELERTNRIAAVVADTALVISDEITAGIEGATVPPEVMRGMLAGVIAALGGVTDPARLNLDPEVTPEGWARFQHLMES